MQCIYSYMRKVNTFRKEIIIKNIMCPYIIDYNVVINYVQAHCNSHVSIETRVNYIIINI